MVVLGFLFACTKHCCCMCFYFWSMRGHCPHSLLHKWSHSCYLFILFSLLHFSFLQHVFLFSCQIKCSCSDHLCCLIPQFCAFLCCPKFTLQLDRWGSILCQFWKRKRRVRRQQNKWGPPFYSFMHQLFFAPRINILTPIILLSTLRLLLLCFVNTPFSYTHCFL